MTHEDVANHRKNLDRLENQVRRIIEPKVVKLETYRKAMEIKNEIRRRIALSETA